MNRPNFYFCIGIFLVLFFLLTSTSNADFNDPLYSQQWGLTAIKAEAGWVTTTGAESVIINIVDSGIDSYRNPDRTIFQDDVYRGHPDINLITEEAVSRIWINLKERYGTPAVDDNKNDGTFGPDGNGYDDDVYGVNLVDDPGGLLKEGNSNMLYKYLPYEDGTHYYYGRGTKLTGIVAAGGNNNRGIVGVVYNSKFMASRTIRYNGEPVVIEKGIKYGADMGAKVILLPVPASPKEENERWTGFADWDAIKLAIKYAHDKGCVLIAPIGNDGTKDVKPPSSFEGVIGVGSISLNNNGSYSKSTISNYNTYVDVVAPGENIITTAVNGTYETISETSAAAAFVAGYAALLFSAHPDWTNTRVEQQIMETAAPLKDADVVVPDLTILRGSQRNDKYGYGIIDLGAGLDITPPKAPTVFPPIARINITSLTLSGTMTAYPTDTRRILVNGSDAGSTYLPPDKWSSKVTLEKYKKNKLEVTALDPARNQSSPSTVEVTVEDFTYEDANKKNSITFPVDSTLTPEPIATVEAYTGEVTEMIGGVRVSDVISIESSVEPLAGKTVVIKISITKGGKLINPFIYYWDESTQLWKKDKLTLKNKDAESITVESTKASGRYAIYDVTGRIEDILIYPIPYKMGSTDTKGVVFSGLAGDEIIKIYTLSGELVYASPVQTDYSWTWEVKNSLDYVVEQDVYYYFISNNKGQKRVGKIAVIN